MIFGSTGGRTQFSWIEYQALMLGLAGVICAALLAIEIALNRFQVLPLLFPGMFSVRERRFFFFNFDISDGVIGKKVRAEAKLVVRLTICLVLSYLWQHCALETTQQVGRDFPQKQCDQGADCFASTLHFTTLFNREYKAIDCTTNQDFNQRTVVSCIRFVRPDATTWLMHLAISHSVTQLNFKSFEVLVWIGGNSKWARRLLLFLTFFSAAIFIGLFFGGVMSEFVSSWLSFVMSLTIPVFLHTVYRSAKCLELLWREEAVKVQDALEEHLSGAFADIETTLNIEAPNITESDPDFGSADSTSLPSGLATIKARETSKKENKKVLSTLRSVTSVISNSAKIGLRKATGNKTGSTTPSPPKQDASPVDQPGEKTWLSPDLAAALEGEQQLGGETGRDQQ